MARLQTDALNPGVRQREVFGWAMYDFANSGYTTVVLTAVFAAYFVGGVAGSAPWATFAWTATLAASSALVMLTMPALGAWADLAGAKKRLLAISTVGCVACTAALALVGPGDVALAVALVLLSNLFYSWGDALIAAFLPELARPGSLGKVSGWGWSVGYLGGMLTLGLSLAWVLSAQARAEPASQFVPVTMLITAAVYALAAMVTFALLRERAVPQPQGIGQVGVGPALARLAHTWRQARQFRDFNALLACGLAYQAGIAVVIALAAVYAEQAMGFKQTETMMLIFLVNIAAAAGAFGWGHVQDHIGHRAALGATLLGWVGMVVLAVAATGPALFWVAAVVAGLCMGSSQSAGRAMAGAFAPAAQRAEFYGLWAFATRLAGIVGPLTYGAVTWATAGNHRLAIACTGVFFVAGWWLLRRVDVARGEASAAEADRVSAAAA